MTGGLSAIGYQLSAIGYQLSAIGYQLSVEGWWPLAVLSAVDSRLSTVDSFLPSFSRLPDSPTDRLA
jgi:hypothetical protein